MLQVRNSSDPPRGDGDVNRYMSGEGLEQRWFKPDDEVVFVNGMLNTEQDHFDAAMALSLLQGCAVVGIYNKKDGFWRDLGQCISDKYQFTSNLVGDFDGWNKKVDEEYEKVRGLSTAVTRVDFVGTLIEANKATYALYRYLIEDRSHLKTNIFAHSQGNLVTSNALTAVALALGLNVLSSIKVYSYGSPCRYWPPGIYREDNAFTFDPVSWLDYMPGFTSSKVGAPGGFVKTSLSLLGPIAHGFEIYRNHDAEFTVNRFRWGSFRMTASMDEKGLAGYLIDIGNNPPRLKGVFKWLIKHHWADSDDIASEYVKIAKAKHPSLLRQIAQSDKDTIKVMIQCLDEGWTTSGEHAQIAYLKSFIA